MDNLKKILLIEDDKEFTSLMRICFSEKFDFQVAHCITEAKLMLNCFRFDLILLDCGLPDGCGMKLCDEIKKSEFLQSIPVLMITARSEISDKLLAFSYGCNDYITKPFDLRELGARITSVLGLSTIKDSSLLKFENIVIDQHLRSVQTENGLVELTSTEFKILMVLVNGKGIAIEREAISDKVWDDQNISMRQVDTAVSKIRKKIGTNRIESVHGVGYRFAS